MVGFRQLQNNRSVMDILIDFDGTCVTHEFPRVGRDIGAVPILKKLVESGHRLILFTMRSNNQRGNFLDDAVDWFKKNDIPLYGIQENPEQKIWTTSPKAYGQLIIDDTCLGIPLTLLDERGIQISDRPFINWLEVKYLLEGHQII